jgi:hypothetical protein
MGPNWDTDHRPWSEFCTAPNPAVSSLSQLNFHGDTPVRTYLVKLPSTRSLPRRARSLLRRLSEGRKTDGLHT